MTPGRTAKFAARGNSFFAPLFSGCGILLIGLDSALQQLTELLQPRGGHDDRVAPTTHILRNAEESPTGILFEIEVELLPFHLDTLAHQHVFHDDLPDLCTALCDNSSSKMVQK